MSVIPSRPTLIAMISKVMNAEGTEDELDRLLNELKELSPRPDITDLIFYPQVEMGAEEIADLLLNWNPESLLPGEKDSAESD